MDPRKEAARILQVVEEALLDGVLSRAELKRIRAEAEALDLPFEQMGWLRSELVKLLQGKVQDERGRAVVDWVDRITRFLPTIPPQEQTTTIYFTPGEDCHQALFTTIDCAKRSLDICVFTITDDRITQRIHAAARRGVRVRIITDNDKAQDLGSDIRELSAAGLTVRVDSTTDHMHHKFAVVDGQKVITGSFNWTRGAANNHENLFICGEGNVANTYQDEFNRLWDSMVPYLRSQGPFAG